MVFYPGFATECTRWLKAARMSVLTQQMDGFHICLPVEITKMARRPTWEVVASKFVLPR